MGKTKRIKGNRTNRNRTRRNIQRSRTHRNIRHRSIRHRSIRHRKKTHKILKAGGNLSTEDILDDAKKLSEDDFNKKYENVLADALTQKYNKDYKKKMRDIEAIEKLLLNSEVNNKDSITNLYNIAIEIGKVKKQSGFIYKPGNNYTKNITRLGDDPGVIKENNKINIIITNLVDLNDTLSKNKPFQVEADPGEAVEEEVEEEEEISPTSQSTRPSLFSS